MVDSLTASVIKEIERLTMYPIKTEIVVANGIAATMAAIYKGPDKGWEPFDVKGLIDKWRDAPQRRVGSATTLTLTSFVELVNRHKDASSAVFADLLSAAPSLTAVIDYHTHKPPLDEELVALAVNSPRFCQHRVRYAFPISDEWKAWTGKSGDWMDQGSFAQWLEDRLPDMANPNEDETELFSAVMLTTVGAPNQIMGLSRNLTINVESTVGSALTLQTGESSVVFTEVHKDGQGQPVKVPGGFVLSIPLFDGGEPRRVPVRLRYRKQGAKIVWQFSLWRAKDVVRSALDGDFETVATETGLPVYHGSPEA